MTLNNCFVLILCLDFRTRVRIFHGINLVCKHAPWYYPQLLDEKYAKNLGKFVDEILKSLYKSNRMSICVCL